MSDFSGNPPAPAGKDLSKMGGLNVDKKDLDPVPEPPTVEPSKKITIGEEKTTIEKGDCELDEMMKTAVNKSE